MHIKYLIILFTLFCVFDTGCVKAQTCYGNLIVASPKTFSLVENAIYDMQFHLSKATGMQFNITKKDSAYTTGIQIIKLDRDVDTSYAKNIPINNADAVWIKSNGTNSLKIISFTQQGLINGIYTYLDTLGFRWFHPGDEWAFIPNIKDVRLVIDKVFIPDFSLRTFFGTFGTPRVSEIDKKRNVDYQWGLWATRNRMIGGLQGHSWTEFMWRHIPELKEHPEYMALVNGKREFPDSGKKFCVSNKGFQKLFTDDMVALLKKRLNGSSGMCSISVEPADGEGECQCDECKKIGNFSNCAFFLANVVAKEFQKISPNAYVNLYAYNTHALPPDFDLEPNVLVQIIPYGYQHYLSPEEMIAAWKKKNHELYIYDYYGLPINNVDMPLLPPISPFGFPERLKYWYQQNIKGATIESSYSIGATGIALYLFARYSWDIHTDLSRVITEYYKDCYGPIAKVAEEVNWHLNYDTTNREQTLKGAMQLLHKGTKGKKLSPAEETRLTDFKAYLHYLKLLYDVKDNKVPEPAGVDSLLRYTYGIFQTMMVHQFPITEYLKNNGPAADYVKQHWNIYKTSDPGMEFSSVVQLTSAQIEEAFEEDCKILK